MMETQCTVLFSIYFGFSKEEEMVLGAQINFVIKTVRFSTHTICFG